MPAVSDEPRTALWDRPATRRAVLAGTAAVAAAGATAGVIGFGRWNDSGKAANGTAAAADQTSASQDGSDDLDLPIADPKRRAAHLLRRAGFGGTAAQIAEFATLSRDQAADRLINFATVDNSALDARVAAANFDVAAHPRADMIRWWFTRMAYTARPLEERMTLIWHGLLTSQVSKIGNQRASLMVTQNELFRKNALPKYDDLLKAVSKDPAMMIYLDTIDSTKEHANENYAREVMELFSLGAGNYTEADIRESARAFTGWRISLPKRGANGKPDYTGYTPDFVVRAALHDAGQKTFMGKTGNFGGDDIIDIIMQQPAAGRHIASRLFYEFANYNPAPDTIDRLTKVWDSSGHQISDVVRAILTSDEFYSERSYRAIVRAPIDLVIGAVRGLEMDTQFASAATPGFQLMDQIPFEPPSVAGWPGGDIWLSSSTFYGRVNFLDAFLLPRGRPATIPALASATTPEQVVDTALAVLVDDNVTDTARASLYDFAAKVTKPDERAAAVAYLVLASPEFQLV